MIVTAVQNIWDTVYDQYRKTVYRTLEDPITHKTFINTEEYLYNKTGTVIQNDVGNNIDKTV